MWKCLTQTCSLKKKKENTETTEELKGFSSSVAHNS